MEATYWQKQTPDKPLYPDLLWSRPEQKSSAGKLLIIGGNVHAFSAPAEAYGHAVKAGAGSIRVVLPDATKKIVGKIMAHVEYAQSTPSGSFNRQALAEVLDLAAWSDCVLVAGDVGRNSETAILLESFTKEYKGQLVCTKDALDYFIPTPEIIMNRQNTLAVITFAQLQKISMKLKLSISITYDMDILRFVAALHEITSKYACNLAVKHHNNMFVASKGNIISTILDVNTDIWRVRAASHMAVWWMQNTAKPLEAIAMASVTYQNNK